MEIDSNTLITRGLPISKNYIIDHVSNGAYHYVLGKWAPQFTAVLRPGTKTNLPLWQIARNLQLGAENILEPLTEAFGVDLIIRSAFLGANSTGQNIGIQIQGYQNNMYGVVTEIQKVVKKASSLELIFDQTSHLNVNFDNSSLQKSFLTTDLATIVSKDLINNISQTGLVALRGII